jgi:hypothetical protein
MNLFIVLIAFLIILIYFIVLQGLIKSVHLLFIGNCHIGHILSESSSQLHSFIRKLHLNFKSETLRYELVHSFNSISYVFNNLYCIAGPD